MKKRIIAILILILSTQLAACSDQKTETPAVNNSSVKAVSDNRDVISKAVNLDEKSLDSIMTALDTLEVGTIKKAEAGTDGIENYIDVTTGYDAVYRIYLAGGGSVDGVKDLSNNEWFIKSER